jgi:hypothetical protein
MMARNANQRDRKYRRKVGDTEHTVKQLELAKEDMATAYEQSQVYAEEMERLVRVILGKNGIPTIAYPGYLNFARQIGKIAKRFQGDSFMNEAKILIDKWTARQLVKKILETILYEVFAAKET